jgi:DNA-binding SARP family transcriptional activator
MSDAAAPRLRIKALGVLCVLDRHGEPIPAAASLRRPMAVLVAAAIGGDRGITRDKLLGLLWPEASAERARHSLTQAIYNARRVTDLDDLFLTHGVLRVNPELVTSDVADFEQAVRDHDLERIVELYDGPFLDGFYVSSSAEFDQWVTTQRARFEESVASALSELADRAEESGRHRDAIEWRRRLASLHPLDSAAVEALVIALARSGDRATALRIVQDHVATLNVQLGLEPDASLSQLLDELRDPGAPITRTDSDAVPTVRRISAPVDVEAQTEVVASAPVVQSTAVVRDRRIRHWRRRLVAAGGLAAVALVVAGAWRGWFAADRTAPASQSAPGLLVAPFSVSGASPSISYLGRGAAQLLAMRLDSAGEERAIDPAVLATAWQRAGFDGRGDVPRDSVLLLADELDARRVVVGSIVGNRARAIISAAVLSLPTGKTTAYGTVEGSADSVGPLTSRLAAKLLIAAAGEDSTLSVRWDPPVPALYAFLNGRRAYRRAEYLDAMREFRVSLRLDSTFAPAALQLARTADRLGDLEEEDGALARAWQYRASLDEAQTAELMALAGPHYPHATRRETQLAAWARIVAISPRSAASWYELGARLIREGRRVGTTTANEQAGVALNHALILDPGYAPARDLLAHLTMRINSGRQMASAVAMVDSSSRLASFLRWRAAIGARDSADLATLRDIRLSWRSMANESARAIAMASQFDAVGLDDGAHAIELLESRATTTAERVDLVLAAHSLALNTDRTADALAQTRKLQELRPDSHGYLRLRVLDALYGNGDTLAARQAAVGLELPPDSLFRDFPLIKLRATADVCILAQWRLSHGDTTGVRAIVHLLRTADPRPTEQLVSATPGVCADLVEATLAVVNKQSDAIALVDRLDDLVLTSAVAGNASSYANIAISRLYVTLGQPSRAFETLRRRTYMAGWPAYLATVYREEEPLARAAGDTRRADVSKQRLATFGASSRPSLSR